jgi:glyceraldehyde 3-phosphate dehydrogenase
MLKVSINGLGRIGRAALKIILDTPEMELKAINDLIPKDNLAYLLKHDSVYGNYEKTVEYDDKNLIIDGKKYPVYNEKDPANLPWKDHDIDVVFECTGVFTKSDGLNKHIQAGAEYAVLSAPAKSDDVPTVVHGVNTAEDGTKIVSCASCTTNCITPVVEVMKRRIGIKKAMMTTIHAYTSTQGIVDSPNKKMRRGRAGAVNLVPTSTGAAKATTKVLTDIKGKFDGVAVRVPVPVGSITDMVFLTEKQTSVEELKKIFKEESESDRYKEILKVTEDELVSTDIIKNPAATIVDLPMTQVVDGDMVKIMAWYDNEWGYANQMIREALKLNK